MKRIVLFGLLSLFLLLPVFGCTPAPKGTEILWDTWGVPHIYADTEEDLFYAFGWAQMRSHGNLILELYGKSRGRAAEFWGEEYLASDEYVWTMGIPGLAESAYGETLSEDWVGVDAFAAGMNAYAEAHPEAIDDRLAVVLPLTGCDVLAHTIYAVYLNGLYITPLAIEEFCQQYLAGDYTSSPERPAVIPVSNAWALGPSKSKSGHPILLSNTHLPWPGRSGREHMVWQEAHLVGTDIDIYGVGLVGVPVITSGFNDFKGWTITSVPRFDLTDYYELTLVEGGYLFDGKRRAFETKNYTLKVRQENGTLREEPLVVRRSVQGPVIVAKEDKTVALKVPTPTPEVINSTQHWNMVRAKNLDEFLDALKPQRMGAANICYADRDGNVMYTLAGIFPERPQGEYDWSGLLPGDTSATLWQGTLRYSRMPRIINPETGYVQNANDPPWTATWPSELNPADYPSDFPGLVLGPRAARSLEMIMSRESFSFKDVMADKFSTHSGLADQVLDALITAAGETGNPLAQEAAEVLANWDSNFDADSSGALLFVFWAMQFQPGVLAGKHFSEEVYAVPADPARPFDTPRGLADPVAAVTALEAAAKQVQALFGSLEVPWGEFARFRLGDEDLPAFAAPSAAFGLFVPNDMVQQPDGRLVTVAGDSWVAVIEFSDPVRAMAVMPYGNATQPGSSHITDQLSLYAKKEYRPIWRTLTEIEDNLEMRERFE